MGTFMNNNAAEVFVKDNQEVRLVFFQAKSNTLIEFFCTSNYQSGFEKSPKIKFNTCIRVSIGIKRERIFQREEAV
jgi:hypothetical protein